MPQVPKKVGWGRSLLFGLLTATLTMLLLWILETLGMIVQGTMAGEGFESLTALHSGPCIALLIYLGIGALPGTVYFGLRWRTLWQADADRFYTACWAATGLHLFLRLSTFYRIHPDLSVHTMTCALVPPTLYFILSGELARAMALATRGWAVQRALLFFLNAVLFSGLTIPLTLGLSRLSPAGIGVLACISICAGGLALFGFRQDVRTRSLRIWTVLALGLLCANLAAESITGWQERKAHPPVPAAAADGNPDGPPVIMVTLDTLRADRMSAYGGPQDTSPLLAALEEDGAVRFADCTSQAPWTVPSTSSMLTGLHPCRLGTVSGPLKESEVTLAERLGQTGYRTAAYSDNELISRRNGFQQGFQEFHSTGKPGRFYHYSLFRGNYNLTSILLRALHQGYQGVDRLFPSVLSWLEQHREQKFFLYLHLMDPHTPYYDHPGFRPGAGRARADRPVTITISALYAQKEKARTIEVGAAQRHELLTRYDAEVRHTDQALGQLFDQLKALGLWDRCLLLICSDHGEEFFEHGSWGHVHSVHRELLHVPLWIKPPASAPAGVRVVSQQVQNLDLAPTVLDAAGLPLEGLPGRSLWPLIRSPEEQPWLDDRISTAASIYLYPDPTCHLSARKGELKCIREIMDSQGSETWYDLAADPGENQPLPGSPGGENARAIVAALDQLARSLEVNSSGLSDDIQARLQAIGYMQ